MNNFLILLVNRAWKFSLLSDKTAAAATEPVYSSLLARLESAYSLIWGSHKIWGQGGGEPLALLW